MEQEMRRLFTKRILNIIISVIVSFSSIVCVSAEEMFDGYVINDKYNRALQAEELYIQPLEISKTLISTTEAGCELKFKVLYKNRENTDKNLKLIIAFYNSRGLLLDVGAEYLPIQANETLIYETTHISKINPWVGSVAKLYVWDDDTMTPLSTPI